MERYYVAWVVPWIQYRRMGFRGKSSWEIQWRRREVSDVDVFIWRALA